MFTALTLHELQTSKSIYPKSVGEVAIVDSYSYDLRAAGAANVIHGISLLSELQDES